MTDQLQQLTRDFRTALRDANVPCTVRMVRRLNMVQVCQMDPQQVFTDDQQRTFRRLAVRFGFTSVRGLPVDVDRDTDPFGADFFVNR